METWEENQRRGQQEQTLKREDRRIDVDWKTPTKMKNLFKNRTIPSLQEVESTIWTDDDLFYMIRGQLDAFDIAIGENIEAIAEKDVRLTQMEAEIIKKDTAIKERDDSLQEKDRELMEKTNEIIALQKTLLENEKELVATKGLVGKGRSRSRSKHRRSSVHQLGGIGAPSAEAGPTGDGLGPEDDSEDDAVIINSLIHARDKLQVDLRNALAELSTTKADKDKTQLALVSIQPLILRLHVYRIPNWSLEVTKAWSTVLARAYEVSEPETKVAKFHVKQGVVFANAFDMPYLPVGDFNIQIVLAVLGQYTAEGVGDQELCAQLAWLNTALDNIDQVQGLDQNAALHRFLEPVISRYLTGLAAALRNIVVTNVSQRSDDLSFYLATLNKSIDSTRTNYMWDTWTILEKITCIWLRALHGIFPEWMDNAAYRLWSQIKPGRCSDFVDVLLKCVDFVRTEENATMFVLDSLERDNTDKMVILRFKSAQWHDCIWVRHQDKVFFTEKALNVRVEVIGGVQVWSVKSTMAKPWFTVQDEPALDYLDREYNERVVEEVGRVVTADEKNSTLGFD